jgi:catechol 2,3-dioxygenase-like lactoylglutathione lyase family enzyme
MAVYNHTGHVVTDLDRAKQFYQEVFGFRLWYEISPPDVPTAQLTGLTPPLGVTASYLTLDGFVLELMHYAADGATAPYRPRTMSEPGLTHLSISVDDVHAAADRAVRHGGLLIEESDIGAALFIRDPDGQMIELLPVSYRDRLPPKP